jgi:hypothetical protein
VTTFEKLGIAIIGVAMATTLVLPDRKTADVAKAFFGGISQWTGTAMGTIRSA